MRSNLTTKKGDSGSAGMLGEKCVIIEAPKFDTIIDQKHVNWLKINKINKNQQNQKRAKIRKCKKVKKWQNQKTEKVKKQKNQNHKSEKSEKMTQPPKTPKCHLNGTFWHFVKSEPPGPAFFEFQGVPRDPVLRPKLTPPYFWCFLHILWFVISTFLCFDHFCIFMFCVNWCFLINVHFHVLISVLNAIRPYW